MGFRRNKGFTLVEVLGVLVILSVIVLIAVPNINKWLKSGTEELYKTQNEIRKSLDSTH